MWMAGHLSWTPCSRLSFNEDSDCGTGWDPRLLHDTPEEHNHWRMIGGGESIHWPDLDEDISVEGLLAGRRSAESDASFAKWLKKRQG